MKTCKDCEKPKPLSEFYRNSKYGSGYEPRCKACWHAKRPPDYKQKNLARYHRNADYHRWHRIFKVYGLTKEAYGALLTKQNGGCAVCSTTPETLGKYLDVDHCHTTNKVRGLLCNRCNQALGLLSHSPAMLTKAMAYLQ